MFISKNSLQKISVTALLALALVGCGSSSPQGGNDSGNNLQTESTTTQIGQNGDNSVSDTGNTGGTNTQTTSAQLSTFQTRAPAEDVTSSDSALFIAEGDKGVEVVQIGYNDRIDHELITTITGINATQLALSDDQKELYVINRQGSINVYDISDIQAPRRTKLLVAGSIQVNPVSTEGNYEFVPEQQAGLRVYDISNPSHKELISAFHEVSVYALVLVDQASKALAATGENGLALLDVADPAHISKTAEFPIDGKTLGLSVNKKTGQLFVANGDKGIKVFNLNILLDELR